MSYLKFIAKSALKVVLKPEKIKIGITKIYRAWQAGGVKEIAKKTREYIQTKTLPANPIVDNTYNNIWLQAKQKFEQESTPQIIQRIQKLPRYPLISILIPVYNTSENWLKEAIESVLAQLYPHWELCIADDASTAPHVKKILQQYSRKDSRIKLVFLEKNSGISVASNNALKIATGEFIILMDHDDLLQKQALYRVAESILEDSPDFLYSDEALMTENGEIRDFVFRPQFSLEFLRSHPYIVHLVGFKTELLKNLGGFRNELTISQDYDLILRVCEQAKCIVHIPEILYCWRLHQTSTGHQKQDQVMETSKSIISQHLKRCNEQGIVGEMCFNFFQVRYNLEPNQKIAIIIPTKNCGSLVKQCIESIEATVTDINFDIILIDHASDEIESIEYFQSIQNSHKVLRYEGNFNFSAINNWAISQIKKEDYTHYLFCNNDIEAIEKGWLNRLLELVQKPDIAIAGPKLVYPDRNTIQHAGVGIGINIYAEHYGKFLPNKSPNGNFEHGYYGTFLINKEVSAVTAACMLMRKDAFEKIGGFDENFAVGFGDVDLCLRTRQAGYRIIFCSQSLLIHHESYTRGKTLDGIDKHPQDTALFIEKWQPIIETGDPYFHPNFSHFSTSWEIKKPLEIKLDINRRVYKK
ncbi:MAG TPA: glycosyltransferase family 2 protein [Halomicronema sp.]